MRLFAFYVQTGVMSCSRAAPFERFLFVDGSMRGTLYFVGASRIIFYYFSMYVENSLEKSLIPTGVDR